MPNPNDLPDYEVDGHDLDTSGDSDPILITVSDGPVFPQDELADVQTIYLAFGCTIVYRKGHGLGWSPLAGEKRAKNAAFWRKHTGVGTKTVTWIAMSVDEVPKCISSDALCDNEVLLDETIGLITPCNAPDGQRCIGLYGIYLYALQKMPSATDQLMMGKSPFDVEAAQVINPGSFDKYIAGPGIPPADFSGGPITY